MPSATEGGRERFSPYGQFAGLFVPYDLVNAGISPGACFLYSRLAALDIKRRGFVWPRQDTLARELSCTTRTVRSYLAELKDAGLVTVEQRGAKKGRLGQSARIVFHKPTWSIKARSTARKDFSGQSATARKDFSGQSSAGHKDRARAVENVSTERTRTAARGGAPSRGRSPFSEDGNQKNQARVARMLSGIAGTLTPKPGGT